MNMKFTVFCKGNELVLKVRIKIITTDIANRLIKNATAGTVA